MQQKSNRNFLHTCFQFLFLFLLVNVSAAQKFNKADKLTFQNLKTHVMFLADDKLEGRRTGTKGEEQAYRYIQTQFEKYGLQPKGDNGGFLQKFEINEGRQVLPGSVLILDGEHFKTERDYFPFAWSKNGSVEAVASPSLSESGAPWFWDLKEVLLENESNPHFDLATAIRNKEKTAAEKGATALLIYNSSAKEIEVKYDTKDKMPLSRIPVVYLQKSIAAKLTKDPAHTWDIQLKTELGDKIRTGNNVVGYINNGAASTIVLGAHFDHLGFGEDHNSRYTGEASIHNGADDNASGTAALLELARLLKKSGSASSNYLFIAFSGEELGLYGSKYYTEHPTISLTEVNFMVNMDMVGRFNDSSKTITIGGVGTSPAWSNLLYAEKKMPFQVKIDSSGTGPSDHTSFYRKNIPVLFFFTGLHTDYHKPTDDYDKINYEAELVVVNYISRLIGRAEKQNKLVFQKTREQQMGTSARFTVSMGIMPDYTFSGSGVKADGVSEGKAAQKAGLKAGDIIIQLGDFSVSSVENYMQVLSKFKKGDATKVKVKRGNEEMVFDIVF